MSDGSVVRASILERSVIQRIVATPDPVLAAHYVAVELLTLRAQQADQPSRGVAVRLPDGVPINAVLLGTLEDLLGQIPELKPVELGTLFATTAESKTFDGTGRLVIPPPGGTATDRTEIAGSIAQRRLAVGQVTSMLQDDDALSPAVVPARSRWRGSHHRERDRFLTARRRRPRRRDEQHRPDGPAAVHHHEPPHDDPHQRSHDVARALKVKVRLTSPKLRFPEGDQVITVTDDSPPFSVPVEAKSNGTSG